MVKIIEIAEERMARCQHFWVNGIVENVQRKDVSGASFILSELRAIVCANCQTIMNITIPLRNVEAALAYSQVAAEEDKKSLEESKKPEMEVIN